MIRILSPFKRMPAWAPTLIAGLALAPSAGAGYILDTSIDTAHTNTIHVNLGTTAGGTDLVKNEDAYAGPFTSTLVETGPGGTKTTLATGTTYCVKVNAAIGTTDSYAGTIGTSAVNSNGGTALNGNGALLSAIADDGTVPTTTLGGEARQLALWSALYNGAGPLNQAGAFFTVSTADLKATAGLETLTDALLARAVTEEGRNRRSSSSTPPGGARI